MDDAKAAIVLARLPAGPLRDAYLDDAPRGWTALLRHVQAGDAAAVARAIADGADVDAIAEGAHTALSLACVAGADAIAAALLAAGADPRARARGDLTVLHLAAAHAPLALVRRLVEAGARIEAVDAVTPLGVAIEHDRLDVLAYLIEQALPWSEPSDAFGLACERGRLDAMRLLCDRFGAAVWPTRAPTALMRAARGGDARAVRFLVERGAEVDELDLKEDLSPLMLAVLHGRHEAARALLDAGADPDLMTEWFGTAARLAERRGDAAMIALLRARGAEAATRSEHVHVTLPYATYSSAIPRAPARSPLDDALATDDVAALARLAPAELDAALDAAAGADAPHCVAYLLAAGAAPQPSALARAIAAGDARAVRLLLAAGAAPLEPTIAHAATRQSDPWILRDVLDRGAAVDTPVYSERPVELAARLDRWAHLALLVARGARLDEDLNGHSPLSIAAGLGNLRSVAILVDHELATGGLQTITRTGAYATHTAGIRRIDMALLVAKDPRVIALLVARGADVALVERLRAPRGQR